MKEASPRVRISVLMVMMGALTMFPISVIAAQYPTSKVSTDSTSTNTNTQHSDQLEVMRTDSKKMHVILNQMQTNLAFVTNTNDPLKHQFELEVEMWQILLNQMDRRIEEMGRREHNPAP